MKEILQKLYDRDLKRAYVHLYEQMDAAFENQPEKLESLIWMEETQGEPRIVFYDKDLNEIWISDTSKESPAGRRNLCYDKKARTERKKNAPDMSVMEQADLHNLQVLDEKKYYWLQQQYSMDEKTSSWLKTSKDIRDLGGAIFGERRYNRTFIFHNSAQSYYSTRGWRALLKIKL